MSSGCRFCGVQSAGLKMCGGCESVWYCSREHQEYDWKRHKPICRSGAKHAAAQVKTSEEKPGLSATALLSPNIALLRQLASSAQLGPIPSSSLEAVRAPAVTLALSSFSQPLFYVPRIEVEHWDEEPSTSTRVSPSAFLPTLQRASKSPLSFPLLNSSSSKSISTSHSAPKRLNNVPYSTTTTTIVTTNPDVPKKDHTANDHYRVSLDDHLKAMRTTNPRMSRHEAFALRIEAISKFCLERLLEFGWAVVDGFLGGSHCFAVLDEIKRLYADREFGSGKLMKSRGEQRSGEIRSDKIYWFDNRTDQNADFVSLGLLIGILDSIIGNLSDAIPNVKINGRSRAMIACYPGNGARYVRHVDNPAKDGRILTCIYYINPTWQKDHGGMLKLFPISAAEPICVEPIFDRFITFWSDKRNPHEVLPAFHNRFAVTVWYFDELEKKRTESSRRSGSDPAIGSRQEEILSISEEPQQKKTRLQGDQMTSVKTKTTRDNL